MTIAAVSLAVCTIAWLSKGQSYSNDEEGSDEESLGEHLGGWLSDEGVRLDDQCVRAGVSCPYLALLRLIYTAESIWPGGNVFL